MEERTNVKDASKSIFTTYIRNRILKNKNFLCAITGPTGSGKTYSALKLAKDWDPNFGADKIVFSLEEFILIINSGELESGSVILFEEAGIAMNNRKWQSFENNMIQFILQTFRHKNYIVIFTAPDFGFIDSASRKLMHAHFMTMGIDFKKGVCNLKPYLLQINQRTGSIYYKFLKADLKGLGRKKISNVGVRLASKELIEEYEVKKSEFTTKLNEDIQEKLLAKMQEKKDKENKRDVRLHKIVEINKLREQGKTWKAIGNLFGQEENTIRMWHKRETAHTQ